MKYLKNIDEFISEFIKVPIKVGDITNESIKSDLKFTKQSKKKGAKTDTYNVSKGGTVIGLVKWSSRMRGYAFLPTSNCETEVKEFIKELMRKRRED